MATTTPNYGWAVPTSTDLVKDGATAIETLGDSIDASMNTALGTKKAGMVLLNTTSFTGVANQSFNDVFSATYDNYRIKINFDNTGTSANFYVKMRASGTDSSVNYWLGLVGRTSLDGAANFGQQDVTVGFRVGFSSNANSAQMAVFDLDSPFLTKRTTIAGSYVDQSSIVGMHFAGSHRNTGSFTGFSLINSAGNLDNATCSIYGYNK